MIRPIRYFGDPVLRRTARPVERFDDDLRALAADMIETMYDANGVGLAAPQVGVDRRLFVALETGEEPEEDGEEPEGLDPAEKRRRWGVVQEHVMVNPEIVEREGVQHGTDGCLSIPGLFVEDMERDLRVRMRYRDLDGAEREIAAEGRFAHVLQHELDHLDGILFFDRLPARERQAFLDEHRAELAAMQREAKALLKRLRSAPAGAR